jgi:regulator of sirC expression with transglutaminase-like and TPR domain
MMFRPRHCRFEAFQLFAEQLPTIDRTSSLLHAAIAISMHAIDDVVPADLDAHLNALAARVLSRVRNRTAPALLAHLHQVLFEEEGFSGNKHHYYQPMSSYIPTVLALRRGLPIALALVYKVVGERVGLRVEGINAPGHFLTRVATPSGWLIVDPYFRGTVLSREEAFLRIETALGRAVPRTQACLAVASNTQWLSRMLANLENGLEADERVDDLAAMNELRQLLEGHALPA